VLIYALLIFFVIYYLLPLWVMVANALKTLDEIRGGDMLAPPSAITLEP
jgi:glucose/mannose transport system permease protein